MSLSFISRPKFANYPFALSHFADYQRPPGELAELQGWRLRHRSAVPVIVKTITFPAKAKFFGQKPAAKMREHKHYFVFIKRKNGIHSVQRDKVP